MNTLVALSAAIRPRIVRLAEALSACIVRLSEVLSAKVGSLLSAIAHRARLLVAPLAGASFAPPFAVAATVLVVAAGLPVVAPLALLGLKHLAVAYVLGALLRMTPRHPLASAGRGLRTAAAVGLLWIAAASFGAGQSIAPRPAVAAAMPAPNAVVSPSCATAMGPSTDAPLASAGAPCAARLARARRLKAATNVRA
jgi:hypothetical protein